MTNMQCPVCEETLRSSERLGIEIDTCPRCRGVWLDRGELEKLVEREGPPPRPRPESRREFDDDDDRHPRRRRPFWTELFD